MMFFLLLVFGFAQVVAADEVCPAIFEEVEADGTVVNIIPFKSSCKGSITSPGHPANYIPSSNIQWRVRGGGSEGVTVIQVKISSGHTQVKSLRLEPRRDVLKIIENHETTLSTISLYSRIDAYGRLVPSEHNYYRSHTNPELRVVFESDAEVEAAGFNISYAFNDCAELDVIEHGVLREELSEGEVRYRLQCDQGYQVGDKQGAHHHYYIHQDHVPYIYCDREEGSYSRYQWVNSELFCGKIVNGNCTEHPILNGRLELIHNQHYKVKCDCELCSVIGPTTLMCIEHNGRMLWEGLQDDHGAEYPQCVAHSCTAPNNSNTSRAMLTSSSRLPGSYYKERCISEIIPDVTRWCLSTGRWTEGFADGQCN